MKNIKLFTYKDTDGIIKELCVLCGEKTKIPYNQSIEYRNFYIDGAGQLCEKCGKKI